MRQKSYGAGVGAVLRLGPDELVEARDAGGLGNRHRRGFVEGVTNPEPAAVDAEEFHDVRRDLTEEVAWVGVLPSPDAVRDPTPVGVDQAPQQQTWMFVDDLALPVLEDDPAFVLRAGPVLREDLRKQNREAVHLDHVPLSKTLNAPFVRSKDGGDRAASLFDDPG